MRSIFKYELNELLPVSVVNAPIITPLRIDYQNGKPYFWAVVDPGSAIKKIKIFRIGTGQIIEPEIILSQYLNTTVAQSEPFVWHWYWVEEGR